MPAPVNNFKTEISFLIARLDHAAAKICLAPWSPADVAAVVGVTDLIGNFAAAPAIRLWTRLRKRPDKSPAVKEVLNESDYSRP